MNAARRAAAVWMARAGDVWETALDFLFPRHCAACDGMVDAPRGHLCDGCRLALIPVVPPFCVRCGDPVDGTVGGRFVCSLCAGEEPAFDLARSAVRFRGPVRPLVHQFKYRDGLYLAGDLAGLLALCMEIGRASCRERVCYVV